MRRGRGFARAGGILQEKIRAAGSARGIAVSRLLTHWAEVAGPELARLCRPVKISYGKGGFGATLTVLARSAAGPILEPQLPALRERVNACYGYNAIARIRVTQTAPQGFAEPAADFIGGVAGDFAGEPKAGPDPEATRAAAGIARDVSDPDLRDALSRLGSHILSR